MAGDSLAFVVFTLVPLSVLAIAVVVSATYAVVLDDRRILLSTILFVLMGFHQTTEVVQFLGDVDPHRNLLGEILETGVNLLAVGAIGYVIWSLQVERQRRERLTAVQQSVLGPDQALNGHPVGNTPEDGSRERSEQRGPEWMRAPVIGRLVGYVLTTLPLGNTANLQSVLERAVRNASITFPIATFRQDSVPPVTVFGDPTYLQEVIETILERLVVYNDSSDPVIEIDVEAHKRWITVVFSHNGSGLPTSVVGELTGQEDATTAGDDLELVHVHAFLERWGGSVETVDGTVRVSLPTPGSPPMEAG